MTEAPRPIRPIRSVCVYCGSSPGRGERFLGSATALGEELVRRGLRLVYGGGSVGLMGRVADTVMAGGGEVIGVIPRGLFSREVAHGGLTELVEVDSMHERKHRMFDEADAFIALPGGFGTLEELTEMLTWAQLGIHDKPIGLLDVDGFWQPLLDFLDHAVEARLLRVENRDSLLHHDDPATLLDALATHRPERVEKWLDLDQT